MLTNICPFDPNAAIACFQTLSEVYVQLALALTWVTLAVLLLLVPFAISDLW